MKSITFKRADSQPHAQGIYPFRAAHRPEILALLFCFFQTTFLQSQHYLIPSRFKESPTPPAPNYQLTQNWAALPTTVDFADRTPEGLTDKQADASVDVFFIHPTTYIAKPKSQYKWNQDLADQSLNQEVDEGPILYQASVFNEVGKIYAPRYRQAHYAVFLTQHLDDKQAALDTAYSDVAHAFAYYLKNWNHNRPFIIASHSQGTIHAARLLKEFVIGTPLQSQLIAAYIPGMPVPTDSLPGLPICQSETTLGCFASWSTYQKGFTPPYYNKALVRAVCVNPISWRYDSLYASPNEHKGSVVKPFHLVRPKICDAQVHGGILWITKPKFPGAFLYQNPNYHIGDFNLFYVDIRKNALLRTQHYWAISLAEGLKSK